MSKFRLTDHQKTDERRCDICGGLTYPPYVDGRGEFPGWYCEEHNTRFANEPIPVHHRPAVIKLTGLRHDVAEAAHALADFPGVEVTSTKTTATITGTPERILNAARQAFLNVEGNEDRPAYRLLLAISKLHDAARTPSLEV